MGKQAIRLIQEEEEGRYLLEINVRIKTVYDYIYLIQWLSDVIYFDYEINLLKVYSVHDIIMLQTKLSQLCDPRENSRIHVG